jgi:hypothetical protein
MLPATQRFPLIPTSCTALIMHFPGSSCTSERISNDALSSPLIPKYPVRVLYVLATSLEVVAASMVDAWLLVRSRGSGGWFQCSQHTFPYHGQRSPSTDVNYEVSQIDCPNGTAERPTHRFGYTDATRRWYTTAPTTTTIERQPLLLVVLS